MTTTVVQFEVVGEEKIHCAGCESRTIDLARTSKDEMRARLEQLGYQVHG